MQTVGHILFSDGDLIKIRFGTVFAERERERATPCGKSSKIQIYRAFSCDIFKKIAAYCRIFLLPPTRFSFSTVFIMQYKVRKIYQNRNIVKQIYFSN